MLKISSKSCALLAFGAERYGLADLGALSILAHEHEQVTFEQVALQLLLHNRR